MNPALNQILSEVAVLRTAIVLANRGVLEDIEDECDFHWEDHFAWYDLRPMTDPHEHSAQVCDMAKEAIDYGIDSGLLIRHPDPARPHLVRIAQAHE